MLASTRRNAFQQADNTQSMVVSFFDDPVVIGLIVLLVAFVFFGYLLMRRTVLGLREGYEDGQRRE
ncbi:hypothetical protein halTADL_3173 [Halohasta litchfieldiae]|nr:hypothetical protein halTADL_3173 [Halohasta litchfieldiae]